MVKIVWDAGHGGSNSTPGKRTPDGEYEWTFNDKVVRAGMLFLRNYENIDQLRVDDATGKTDVPLNVRTNRANAYNADIYISVHHNALQGEYGPHSGTETFVMTPASENPESLRLANAIHPKLVQAMGLKNRGVKAENFHVLRETNMPAILTEGGFMDSSVDIVKMRDDAVLKQAGEAIAKGIAEYFGLRLMQQEQQEDMVEKAIVINSIYDYPWAEILSIRLKAPIYPKKVLKEKRTKELIIVGGTSVGLEAAKITLLSGKDRFETAAKVQRFLKQ
ncbi:N-acetylmuramoyl-L-alanine amidase [Jeotgalibacillus sp. S-D1]|uniref:N-acetylmuramoyl-L-alanine amidase family protein n=1 Tax=Jeotgalibacillus sp. S-D1 TaxID=2552189 RepID=UPI00105AA80D|nr:N-acetylmuramoyl-L-alanine amidase [Jeotgalibacillus sp. S-D1]TDL31001.1 N-acetylmuramoyl-L-alanine amidase [Jeotgalibacillus sp. S-D1]